MKTIKDAIADRVDRYCRIHKSTYAEIACRVGVSKSMISQYLNGTAHMTDDKIIALCRAIECHWTELDVAVDIPEQDPRIEKMKAMVARIAKEDEYWIKEMESAISGVLRMVKREQGIKEAKVP